MNLYKFLGIEPKIIKYIKTPLGVIELWPSRLLPDVKPKTEQELLRENIDKEWKW